MSSQTSVASQCYVFFAISKMSDYAHKVAIQKTQMASSTPSYIFRIDTWELGIGLPITRGEQYCAQRVFKKFQELGCIGMHEFANFERSRYMDLILSGCSNLCKPQKYSDMERAHIQAKCQDLLEERIVEKSYGEYAFTTIMLAIKDIHGNWTNMQLSGDYWHSNKQTKFDRYAVSIY